MTKEDAMTTLTSAAPLHPARRRMPVARLALPYAAAMFLPNVELTAIGVGLAGASLSTFASMLIVSLLISYLLALPVAAVEFALARRWPRPEWLLIARVMAFALLWVTAGSVLTMTLPSLLMSPDFCLQQGPGNCLEDWVSFGAPWALTLFFGLGAISLLPALIAGGIAAITLVQATRSEQV
jgi:hypothetical protein